VRRLNFQLKQLCKHNRDGSYGTQVQRERVLTLIANQLVEVGYRQMHAKSLRPKHVEALVKHWQETGVAIGTIKNRMSALRWWAARVNKRNVMARSNDHYGLPRRQYANGANRAKDLRSDRLERITDPHVKLSLRLQAQFGLRREEAIKIRPKVADRGNVLWLKPSWTKGGRAREIPILTTEQRKTLDDARALAGAGSLIPARKTYVQQLRLYEGQCIRAGLSRMHGLRHAYAQRRYRELCGLEAPAAGGPKAKELTPEQRALAQKARALITEELGHRRLAITCTWEANVGTFATSAVMIFHGIC